MQLKTLITILISAFFLVLAVWNFELEEFSEAVSRMHPIYFLPALISYLSSFVFRAIRWRIMLQSVKAIPIIRLFPYLVIGYMANNLLPARLGEIVRGYVTGKSEKMSRSSAFASVVLERLFDGITIVIILIGLMFFADVHAYRWIRYLAWVSSALFLGGLGFLFALAYQGKFVLRVTRRVVAYLPNALADKILHILERFMEGLNLLKTPKDIFVSILLSFPVWAFEVGVYALYLKAFNIDAPMTAAALALVVVNLSSLIPSSPGFIGVFQFACIKSLAVFGVGASVALAWSVAVHGTQIIPITLLGLFFLSKLGLSMGEISNADLSEEGKPKTAGDAPNSGEETSNSNHSQG